MHSSNKPETESEERYRKILANLIEGCAIIDFNWSILFANQSILDYAKLTHEKAIGSKLTAIIPGIESSIFYNCFKICMEERIPQKLEDKFTFAGKGSSFYFTLPAEEG
jgi:PAS domain S-box-containing protein